GRREWLFSLGHGDTVARPVLGDGLRARDGPVYEEGAEAKPKPQEAQTVCGKKDRQATRGGCGRRRRGGGGGPGPGGAEDRGGPRTEGCVDNSAVWTWLTA